jgi:hypothetical protein
MTYINSIEDKSRIFLITNYKLNKQDINGINVIEKTNMHDKHVLVTNEYLSDIKSFNDKAYFLKTMHKMFLNEIPFEII